MNRLSRGTLALGVLLAAFGSPCAAGDPGEAGYLLYESTAATVNGEVIFLADVVREACFRGCGAYPGDGPAGVSLAEARDRIIADTLVIQEQEKLELGTVDNAALREAAGEAMAAMERCSSPCARGVPAERTRDYVRRRLLVRDFLKKRVSVFIDVQDEEVQREIQRRASRAGTSPEEIPEETVRRELFAEKAEREIRNWFDRATSKSRILLSPLEER